MGRPRISVLVHTLNEADQIADCLDSVGWADEVLLLDSFSTDGTPELVRARFPNVRVEQRVSLGSAAQKNYGMDRLENDWVFVLDADERVTPELRDEILATLEAGPRFWAYSIGRRNFVLGEELHYSGLQRDRVTRLFNRLHARYPNKRVHADLHVDGPSGRLRSKIIHYYVRSFDHMTEKMTRYGLWGAAQMFIDGKRGGVASIVVHTLSRFLRDYVVNLGVLDGTRGVIVVGFHTYYAFWKYVRLWELSHLQSRGLPVPLPEIDHAQERWVPPWEESESRTPVERASADGP